jgi:CTP-dependent riboflavin kinase
MINMNAEEFKKQFKKKLGFGFNKGPLNLNSSIKSNQYYKIIKLKTLFIKEFWWEKNWDDVKWLSTLKKHSQFVKFKSIEQKF